MISRGSGFPPGWPRRGWRDRLAGILADPALLRPVFAVLRRMAPIVRFGKSVVVSSHSDVVEVLRRDEDFTIAEVNAARIERWSGSFILGLDNGEKYEREHAALRRAASVDDLDRIRELVVGAAATLIDGTRPAGRIDVVGGYARVVAAQVVGDYFGTPGPDLATTMRWMRAMFDAVFIDDSPRARRAAELTVAEQRPYMEALIKARRSAVSAGEATPDDVIGRLVAMGSDEPWLDDDAVRRNVNGLIVGALETTSKTVAHVIDELLRHPDALEGARQAALAGDVDTVRGYAWEALRFRPHAPGLERFCAKATTLGARKKPIRAGSVLLVSTMSASFDPSAFPKPDKLLPDRPDDRYLTFGHGLHTCFGLYINTVQVTELVVALVRLPGLRRAPGADGRIAYDGPFPDRLVVQFDRGSHQ